MVAKSAAVAVAIIVAVLGAAIYADMVLGPFQFGTGSTSVGSSGSATTLTSTVSTACSTSTTSQAQVMNLNGTFYASPSSPIRIDSVSAAITTGQGGVRTLQFDVHWTNVGVSPVFVVRGCGSTLNSTITSGGSVVETTQGGTRCLCAEQLYPVYPNQTFDSMDPGCWSGYSYQVRQSGTFSAQLTLGWSSTSQFGSQTGKVTILATFTIP